MPSLHATFLLLLSLTALSVAGVRSEVSSLLLLAMGVLKLELVALRFMELGHAHLFWKTALLGLPVVFLLISILILS